MDVGGEIKSFVTVRGRSVRGFAGGAQWKFCRMAKMANVAVLTPRASQALFRAMNFFAVSISRFLNRVVAVGAVAVVVVGGAPRGV